MVHQQQRGVGACRLRSRLALAEFLGSCVDSQAPPSDAHGPAASFKANTSPYLTKWGLFLTVVPLTALFAIAKFGVHQLGWEP
jgi:hypothetical protein